MIGLYDIMDIEIADQLNVSVETYINVIENMCNQEDRDFIVTAILLEEEEEDVIEAKSLFNSYLHE